MRVCGSKCGRGDKINWSHPDELWDNVSRFRRALNLRSDLQVHTDEQINQIKDKFTYLKTVRRLSRRLSATSVLPVCFAVSCVKLLVSTMDTFAPFLSDMDITTELWERLGPSLIILPTSSSPSSLRFMLTGFSALFNLILRAYPGRLGRVVKFLSVIYPMKSWPNRPLLYTADVEQLLITIKNLNANTLDHWNKEKMSIEDNRIINLLTVTSIRTVVLVRTE